MFRITNDSKLMKFKKKAMRQEQKKIMEQYRKLKKKKPKKAWFDTTQRKVGMLKFDIIIIWYNILFLL